MSSLHDNLIENYAEHYAQVNNDNIDPTKIDPYMLNNMESTYGCLLSSLPEGSKILDLGCGTGFLLKWLSMHPKIVPVGVDGSPTQVAIAQDKLSDIDIICADGLEFLRSYQSTFAGIFCIDVLEHMIDDDTCLEWVQAAKDSLIPGGFFCCRTPNAASMISTYCRYMDMTHKRSFSSHSMLQLLRAAGLKDNRILPVRSTYFRGWLRLKIERAFHKAIFRVCGHSAEDNYSMNLCAVGCKEG